MVAEVSQLKPHHAAVDGDTRFRVAHLIAPFFEVVAAVGVEVVPYLLHALIVVYKHHRVNPCAP
ncbi:hypothetical protein XFF6166_150049 [Xanthomonas citri pv. fuscans]|nr:hypothetical protein XFF6166_150049 [Xanthomonas citri pv. fuscans]